MLGKSNTPTLENGNLEIIKDESRFQYGRNPLRALSQSSTFFILQLSV